MKSEGLINTTQLCEFFDVTRETIGNWRKAGLPFIRLSPRQFRYRIEDLEKWFGAPFPELELYIANKN